MLAGILPMIESITAMQATIEDLLATEPITAQEIADKSGATVAVARWPLQMLKRYRDTLAEICEGAAPCKGCIHG